MRGVRAGKQRDTDEQGNETSTAHRNTGHSITSSARVAGSTKVRDGARQGSISSGHLQRRNNG
jgi:hypothetical protein